MFASDSAPKEKCGVIGIWNHPQAAHLTYLGLYAQQHRGQESAGIAVSNGQKLTAHTGMGLVSDVFDGATITRLSAFGGAGAIGHNRYSTSGGSLSCNAQPLLESFIDGQVAVAHNGNLVNADALRARFSEEGHLFHTTSDTEVVIHLLAHPEQRLSADPLAATLRRLQGAFSLVLLFADRIEAARDPWGWRPLVLGKMPSGQPVVASETVALVVMGATFVREIEPGEIVTLDDTGVSSRRFAPPAERRAMCVFEHVYFANPASDVFGQNVLTAREAMGAKLAEEAPVPADFVMPMPDSGRSAANGYARASGLPYREGIVPNRYVGRTFIKPTDEERKSAVRLKLNVVSEIVKGRRLVLVDDSIVRGTTTREKMAQLREAGAAEIHLRISCPPIRHPCYFGVDFATREQLIAHRRSIEDIRAFLNVDSLHFLSLEGLLSVMKHEPQHYCAACYTGEYPIDIEHPMTESVVEKEQLEMFG
ncbi:MAG: amidophosphoribosyltransferase [Phycisphaeraceae bacterium]|nr:amidophosphoribosyltransferase [Phycisphaeraceae bacterium]MCW5764227.1 amidophosphoribosyltransferase [Phycisphaeraceae bacterium]